MREILFRGKRIDGRDWVNSQWAYGDFVHEFMDLGPCISAHRAVKTAINYGYMPVDIETVSQYIGPTDKNGRKIFEGDVFEYTNVDGDRSRYLVAWQEAEYLVKCLPDLRSVDSMDCWEPDHWEVIGNRWDDPEFLEEAEDG